MLSLSVLLEMLNYQHTVNINEEINPEFEWLRLYSPNDTQLDSKHLMVCKLSEIIDHSNRPPNIYYLCLRDRISDNKETDRRLKNLIIVNENISFSQLFNAIQSIFEQISSWIQKMQTSVIAKRGIQDLLDLSESVIKNFVSVIDQSFKLVAHSKNIPCDDPVVLNILKTGYHPDSMIKNLRKHQHIEYYRRTTKILVDKSYKISNYIALEKAYHFNNTFTTQVILTCCNEKYTACQKDLFEILTKYIEAYVVEDHKSKGIHQPYAPFICDLLDEKVLDANIVSDRANILGIPFRGYFSLFVLSFKNNLNTPLSYVANQVATELPLSKILVYHQHIICLNSHRADIKRDYVQSDVDKLSEVLDKYQATCGVSNYVEDLCQLSIAYRQSIIASTIKKGDNQLRCNSFWFEDYYLYYIFEQHRVKNADMIKNCFAEKLLRELRKYDKKNNSEYANILFTYLSSESNASAASKELHMHRNNIVYHINKIKERFHLNLNDPETRFKLLLAFYMEGI